MSQRKILPSTSEVAAIILAGGEGNRLFPLTTTRCKPAVTFGGRYRIIDVALSNSINSNIRDIYVISQFLASTLNNYLTDNYSPDAMQDVRLEILSPESAAHEKLWYEGTADAIRKNLHHLERHPAEYFVILSGDQLYSMDLSEMLAFAKAQDSDLTIAALTIPDSDAPRMGILKTDNAHNIIDFIEKPDQPALLDRFRSEGGKLLGSMGIYIFKRKALIDLLHQDLRSDFGKHLIPTQLQKGKTSAYLFTGYWEDIGTIASFYEANLKLTRNHSCLDLYNKHFPIYAPSTNLPSARLKNAKVSDSIICEGSIIEASEITGSMIGICSHIAEGTSISHSILMGSNFHIDHGYRPSHIGKHCTIHQAIIDEGAQIGDHVTLTNPHKIAHYDSETVAIRDGIIIVKAGAQIPNHYSL